MGLLQSPHMVLDAPYLMPVVLLCYYRLVVLLSSLAVVTPSFCSLAWDLWFTLCSPPLLLYCTHSWSAANLCSCTHSRSAAPSFLP